MAIMESSLLQTLLDRAASQYKLFVAAAEAAAQGTGMYESITASEDPDVEVPTLGSAETYDAAMTQATVDAMYSSNTNLKKAAVLLDAHAARVGVVNTSGLCGSVGVRAPESFARMYYASRGSNMLSRQVFKEEVVTMGSCEIGSGGMTFVAGEAIGDGTATQTCPNGYAGAQLAAIVSSSGGIGSGLSVRITGVSEVGATRIVDASGVIVGPSGTVVPIPPPSGRFVSVSDVEVLGGGSVGESFTLVNIVERTPSL